MEDGELICKDCGYEAPLMEAREKLAFLKNKHENSVLSSARSSLFVGSLICFVLMTVGALLNAVQGNLIGVLPVVFMILSLVGMWKSLRAKDNSELAPTLKSASLFDAYNMVICRILAAASLIVSIPCAIAMLVLKDREEMSGFAELLNVGGIALIVFGVAAFVVCLLFSLVYTNRRKYFLALSEFAEKTVYSRTKAPTVGSWVIGIFTAIGGLGSFLGSLVSAAMLSAFASLMEKAAGMVEIPGAELILPVIDAMAGAFAAGLIFSAISQIAMGIYYITSAVWMSRAHMGIMATGSFVDHEQVRRLELERRTKEERERMRNSECEMQNAPLTDSVGALPEGEPFCSHPNAECKTQNSECEAISNSENKNE